MMIATVSADGCVQTGWDHGERYEHLTETQTGVPVSSAAEAEALLLDQFGWYAPYGLETSDGSSDLAEWYGTVAPAAIRGLQALIDSGAAWRLEGSVGREAMEAIEDGRCVLGPEATTDTYGNRIPSRDEVEPGTKGSREYQEARAIDLARDVLGIEVRVFRF